MTHKIAKAAALFLLAPAVVVAQQNMAYGIEIGGPVTLSECPRTEIAGSVIYGLSTRPCIEAMFPKAKVPWKVEDGGLIAFHPAESPAASSSRKIGLKVMDGKVAVLVISTAGAATQEHVFDTLVAKYGKPTKSGTVAVTNALGSSLNSIVADWDLGDALQVSFVGVAGRLDSGQLLIGTRAGIADRQAQLDKLTKGKPL